MLPFKRAYLKLCFRYGVKEAESFLSSFHIILPTPNDKKRLFQKLFKGGDFSHAVKFLKTLDREKEENKKLMAIALSNEKFDPFKYDITSPCMKILMNRDLRIFIEPLILSGCPSQIIFEHVGKRFRMNPKIRVKDIERYAKNFFCIEEMDDVDWQRHIMYIHAMHSSNKRNLFWKKEFEHKNFALRHGYIETMMSMGLNVPIPYQQILGYVSSHVFRMVAHSLENEEDFSHIEKQINTLDRIAGKWHKHSSDNGSSDDLDEFLLDNQKVEELPLFEDD